MACNGELCLVGVLVGGMGSGRKAIAGLGWLGGWVEGDGEGYGRFGDTGTLRYICGMKECLNCKKEYANKREASKFCSGKCRVKWHRDNPSDKIAKAQSKGLLNEMMEISAEMKEMVKQMSSDLFMFGAYRTDGQPLTNLKPDTPLSVVAATISSHSFLAPQTALKSFEQWQRAKVECENEDDWEKIKAGIEAATNLTQKQKNLLIKYS